MVKDLTCTVPDCERKQVAKGLCHTHYERKRTTGILNPGRKIGDCTGANNSCWRGGITYTPDGRALIYSPNHPYAGVGGKYVLRYRLVMEKHLSRYLLPDEIVHHIDEDCTNDDLMNLLLVTPEEHSWIHADLNKYRNTNTCKIGKERKLCHQNKQAN